jgi:hypothetical protein
MTPFSYCPTELDTGIRFHVQDDQGTMTMNLETISIGCYMMLAHLRGVFGYWSPASFGYEWDRCR